MPLVKVETLSLYIKNIFIALRMPEEDAQLVADNLLFAELRGVPSHGVSRIPTYTKRLMDGAANPQPNFRWVVDLPALKVMDADGGMGQVSANQTIHEAIEMAHKQGSATVFVRNSNHFGMASYFTRIAAKQGMAAIAFSNAPPAMAAWGGTKAVLGTNPISFAFPQLDAEPIIIDMATSLVARGKLREAEKEGRSIPLSWALDPKGIPTDDPTQALKGTLSPVGGVKGYCLAVAVELLAGVLSGAGFCTGLEQMVGGSTGHLTKDERVGHTFIVIALEALLPQEEWVHRMKTFNSRIRGGAPAEGVNEIYLPGELESIMESKRQKAGIQLSLTTIRSLHEIGREYGLEELNFDLNHE